MSATMKRISAAIQTRLPPAQRHRLPHVVLHQKGGPRIGELVCRLSTHVPDRLAVEQLASSQADDRQNRGEAGGDSGKEDPEERIVADAVVG
jgi:hypothetical protein